MRPDGSNNDERASVLRRALFAIAKSWPPAESQGISRFLAHDRKHTGSRKHNPKAAQLRC